LNKKTNIYLCSGCGIGECINTQALEKEFNGKPDAVIFGIHPSLCSGEGLRMILDDLDEKNPDSLLIAACSPRFKTREFDFPGEMQVERVSLREQVAWNNGPGEDAQMAAADYIRMGLARLSATNNPVPFVPEDISEEIMVVGAGITGITASIEGAKAGYRIHLVEKESHPGGWAVKLHTRVPDYSRYAQLAIPEVRNLVNEVTSNQRITFYPSTTIDRISGQPGDFTVNLENGSPLTIKVGAVVAAMGLKPYDASNLGNFGYGRLKNVITSVELEEMIKNGRAGELPEKILFIQCAGSRDKDHLPYCSSFCCNTTLRQAIQIRADKPDSSVFVVYRDMRTPGLFEEFYREVQKDEGIFLTRGEIIGIFGSEGRIRIDLKKTPIGDEVTLHVDMVVLATGIVPSNSLELNLNYRQGKGLPDLKYGFPDSHFICFPYETRRTGIYAAGALRAPMDISSSVSDARGAMLKAIQCVESVKRGEAVHPRSGDTTYPDLFLNRCTDCKRCTEECPFGSYDENEKGTPLLNPSRCRRCGICLGACPERVISFADYSINSISAMIKSVEIPDEFEEKPRILAFVCENDAYPAFDMAAAKGLKYSTYVRIIPVRCIGSVNKVWISDALSCGYDGILQIGCKSGENYQCHFIQGSELTEKRSENIRETLQTMMLEPERIKTVFLEITDYHKIPGIINDYVEEIERIGPNPFKGM
jgi:quinone-modifying oxidoreductase, subunit QmoB